MKKSEIICLIPVFNDWDSLVMLLADIETEAKSNPDFRFRAVVVNDGSTQQFDDSSLNTNLEINRVDLQLNVGHQRAIAIGVQYISNEIVNKLKDDGVEGHVVVMDGDGEDKPSDIVPMVKKADGVLVFAQRLKRSEGIGFRIGYNIYKLLFKLLTGISIDYGNFSAIPFPLLENVALLPNLWNHYASSITESRIKFSSYPTERGKRYAGKSKMNTMNLVIHGFSAISVYFDKLCFRVLKFSFLSILVFGVLISFVFYKKLFTDDAIPGWASSLILIVLSIVIQLFSVTFIILLFQLSNRKIINPPNKKLYLDFIK
ncbi:MAG: glycosyltransferase [Flavobacteriaceae bacterium]|nr:glycosyltransferase [Flavobacteriaceae bacterium]